jgi:hypothetical protein
MTVPTSEIVMQQLAQLLVQCNAYNRDHQRAVACLNTMANIAEQHQITKTAWQQITTSRYGIIQGGVLCEENGSGIVYPIMIKQPTIMETLLARQINEIEQTIAELRRVWQQQSKLIYAMYQIQKTVQKWPTDKREKTAASSHKIKTHNEETKLTGIISVHYDIAKDWIESIVDGYTREHQWQKQILSPIPSHDEYHTKESTENDDIASVTSIDWDDAMSIRRCAERWAALPMIDMTIEEKIQDYVRIYRLWQVSQ